MPLGATALGAFLAAVAASTAFVLATGLARRTPEARAPEQILALAVITNAVLLIVLFLLGRRLLALRPRDLGFLRPPPGALRSAILAGGGLWLLSIAVNAVNTALFGPNPQALVVSVGAHSGAAAFVLDMLTGAVVAPLAEETLFRGLIFGGLARHYGVPAAAVTSALLFALTHGLGVVLPIFVLGVGLAYVYARAGTIWAPMVAHSVVNAISLALLFLMPRPG